MRTFVVIAILGLVIVGIACATVLNTWFKYDAPYDYEWQKDDRD